MSADIERIFSRGRLILLHVCNGMSSNSIRALLCLSDWSKLGLIENEDMAAVTLQVDNGAEIFTRESAVV